MCLSLQACTHNCMGKCFGTWARLITKYNRIILLIALAIYIAVGQNVRNATAFPVHVSESYVWAPFNNPSMFNEQKSQKMLDVKHHSKEFWIDVNNESDPAI